MDKKIINKACDVIKNEYEDVDYYDHIYPFTTENIDGYLDNFDFKNKKILTTGSSCDQILNFASMGCRNITCFDINPFINYYYDLKVAALKMLTPEEFVDFFGYKDTTNKYYYELKNFDKKIYEKISTILPPKSKDFWDNLYRHFNELSIRVGLFSNDEYKKKVVKQINRYLKPENYYKLRKEIDKTQVKFIKCNVVDLPNVLKEKYDIIFLSNIMQNLEVIYKKDYLENLKKLVKELEQHLTKEGKIEICYLYKVKKYNETMRPIYNTEGILDIFDKNNIKIYNLKSIESLNSFSLKKDAIIVYEKDSKTR